MTNIIKRRAGRPTRGDKTNDVHFTTTLIKAGAEKVREHAYGNDMSLSKLIRKAVYKYINYEES